MPGGEPGELEVLARRIDIVERLSSDALHKADMVEHLDHSRSTVNRAIAELEEAGYVERVADGYVTTHVGQQAAASYRAHLDAQRTILDAEPVLEVVDATADVPAAVFDDATVVTTDPAYRLFELLAEALRDAASFRLVLPAFLDSRHLRLARSRIVEDDTDVTLQATAETLTEMARTFPHLWSELEASDSFTALRGAVPSFGLVVPVDGSGRPTAATLVGVDDGDVTGYVHSRDRRAAEWALERSESLGTEARTPSAPLADGPAADLAPMTDDRLPTPVRTEGFVRVDDRYFDRREPMAPEAAWRAGLALPEVAAGYAVDRRRTGDGSDDAQSLTDHLFEGLRDGTNLALVGPPGSGKSTVCKAVACRWFESNEGHVLYREGGQSQTFESTSSLETYLSRVDGRVLVVVEDAVRADANAVFEVMASVSGRDDVVFLLDARESEWHSPVPADARLRTLRREAVETVTMPPLSEDDCRRLMERVESVTDTTLDVSPAALLSDLRDDAGGEATPELVSLLFHRLARYVEPLGGDRATSLDAAVDEVRTSLSDRGDTALDVGVLVNVLNAAGLGVHPAYVHALATEPGVSHDAVDSALDHLTGAVVFASGSAGYRAVHETWSTRFLERLLSAEGEAAAERRFGRVVSALLALADEPARRKAVARAVAPGRDGLERVTAAPSDWADDVATSLFTLGRRCPKLAPLFGTSEASHVTLPSACSAETVADCTRIRGQMYMNQGGALERAEAEFEHLDGLVDDLPSPEADRARLRSLLGRSDIAMHGGDYETAATLADEARALASEVDLPVVRADATRREGRALARQGRLDEARAPLEESLVIFEDHGDNGKEANCRKDLGNVLYLQGEYDRARDAYRRALELYREDGYRRGQAIVLNNLGSLAKERAEYDRARERFQRSLAIDRELGNDRSAAIALSNLGQVARRTGRLERAREYYERAYELREELGNDQTLARSLNEIGELAWKRGDLEEAREHVERALELARDVAAPADEVASRGWLSRIARDRGEYDRAREQLDRAFAALDDVEKPVHVMRVELDAAELALATDDPEAARSHATEARRICEELDAPLWAGRTRALLGRVAAAQGDPDAAIEQFETAVDTLASIGANVALLETLEHLADVATDAGADGRAERACDRAATVLERVPDSLAADHREWVDRYARELEAD